MPRIFVFTLRPERAQPTAEFVGLCARRYLAETGRPYVRLPAPVRSGFSKPRFEGAAFAEFSLTHSGGFFACAFSPLPVGLDLQQHRPCRAEAVARRFFHPEEYRYVLQHGDDGFFSVWCAKESYVKLTGEGITDRFGTFSAVSGGQLSDSIRGAHVHFLPFAPGYTLCLCCRHEGQIIPISL